MRPDQYLSRRSLVLQGVVDVERLDDVGRVKFSNERVVVIGHGPSSGLTGPQEVSQSTMRHFVHGIEV